VQATAVTVPSGGLPEELLARGNFFTAHTYAGRWNSLLGGPSAFSKRARFHCQAKIKIIFVSPSIFDSNDAKFVNKSRPACRSFMRVAPIVFQIYGLQKQGRDRERADTDFFTASETKSNKGAHALKSLGTVLRTRINADHADLNPRVSAQIRVPFSF